MNEHTREITLGLLLKTIKANLKSLLALTLITLICVMAVVYSKNSRAQNIYLTSGIIQINNQAPNVSEAQQIIPDKKQTDTAGNILATKSQVIEALLGTEYVLGPVIKANHLNILVSPIKQKWINNLIHKRCSNSKTQKLATLCDNRTPFLILNQFNTSPDYVNKNFIFRIVSENKYQLIYGNQIVITGTVGQMESSGQTSIQVESMSGQAGSQFNIVQASLDRIMSDLSKKITIEPVIVEKSFSPPVTGLLKITMVGNDPYLQAQLINEILIQIKQKVLLQQGNALQSSINFIDQQIATVAAKLKSSQENMVAFQTSHEVVSLDDQSKEYIHELSLVEQSILENKIAITQFGNLYAAKHPLMQSLYAQRDSLQGKKTIVEGKLTKLPKNEAVFLNLKRYLEVNQTLYSFLLNKSQELKITFSSLTSPIEIITYATPNVQPTKELISANLEAGVFLLLVTGITFVLCFFVFWNNSDPWLMPELSQVPLLAVIPHFPKLKNFRVTNRSLELITSYLLQKNLSSGNPLVVNLSGMTRKSGQSFITDRSIKFLTLLNKKCMHINFGLKENFLTLQKAIEQVKYPAKNMPFNHSELFINSLSAMDHKLMLELFSYLDNFDFIFLEPLSVAQSSLFLTLSSAASINILLTTPKDSQNQLKWFINDIRNMNIKIDKIIFNNPKKTWIKSIYALESYNK